MPRASASKKKEKKPKVLQITLVRSPIGYSVTQKATVRALGLRKMHQTVEQLDTPTTRGMIASVRHLLAVAEVEQQ